MVNQTSIMPDILDNIVAQKREEIKRLHEQFDLDTLRRTARPSGKNFYRALSVARAQGEPFFIAEFKRKSPSEGWIARDADVRAQVNTYRNAGAGAISVLTDEAFFGGGYADLAQAAQVLAGDDAPLLLQKDFVLDPIQIFLARLHGADIILLIAAILTPERLLLLQQTAERLGMGVLVEVHDQAEFDAVSRLDFPVLGINSRDLRTFRTALNRVHTLARQAGRRFVIAESGIGDYRDFRIVRSADGFLIGTSLMRRTAQPMPAFSDFLRSRQPGYLFKACGIRTAALLSGAAADYTGVNFSPVSKRRFDPGLLGESQIPGNAVAVFYRNSEDDIRDILARFPFRIVQLYAGDVTPAFVRSLRQKVLLAGRVHDTADLEHLNEYAADIDLFILDGAVPGSGRRIKASIPVDFPYPFLLAGGMHAGNLDAVLNYQHCIGIDVASGIETDGQVDPEKIAAITRRLAMIGRGVRLKTGQD